MFQLTADEEARLRSQFVILKKGRGQRRNIRPTPSPNKGVAMLSSVLNSPRAVQVNSAIMRTFVNARSKRSCRYQSTLGRTRTWF